MGLVTAVNLYEVPCASLPFCSSRLGNIRWNEQGNAISIYRLESIRCAHLKLRQTISLLRGIALNHISEGQVPTVIA